MKLAASRLSALCAATGLFAATPLLLAANAPQPNRPARSPVATTTPRTAVAPNQPKGYEIKDVMISSAKAPTTPANATQKSTPTDNARTTAPGSPRTSGYSFGESFPGGQKVQDSQGSNTNNSGSAPNAGANPQQYNPKELSIDKARSRAGNGEPGAHLKAGASEVLLE